MLKKLSKYVGAECGDCIAYLHVGNEWFVKLNEWQKISLRHSRRTRSIVD
jgi:hypothetical protein